MTPVNPERLYSFAEAACLIPSGVGVLGLSPRTLYTWRAQGRFEAHEMRGQRRNRWFVRGRELLLKLLPPGWPETTEVLV